MGAAPDISDDAILVFNVAPQVSARTSSETVVGVKKVNATPQNTSGRH